MLWARAEGLLGRVVRDFRVTWAWVERGVGRVAGGARARFLVILVISLFKDVLWEGRKELVEKGVEGTMEGLVRRVEADLVVRMGLDERRFGFHAARERWKGGLGLMWGS